MGEVMRKRANPEAVAATRLRLREVFKEVRRKGLIARMNFSCCSSCAGYAISRAFGEAAANGKRLPAGAVFWHQQDNDHFIERGELYLAFGQISHSENGRPDLESSMDTAQVGAVLASALERHGVQFRWDGSPDSRIMVVATLQTVEAAEAMAGLS